MPELPEVETVRRVILPQVKGQQILSVEVRHPQVIAYPEAGRFASLLTGQTIADLRRRGKYLCFCLESGDRLYLHLRMTGQLLVTPAAYPLEKHTHLRLSLSGGGQIRYIDVRRFGRFWLMGKEETDERVGVLALGMEPLDEQLTAEMLKDRMGCRRKPIKALLNDQTIVAGIGNLYSDEILFRAKLHPLTMGTAMDDAAWIRLAEAIPAVMAWGIEADQMTPEEYLASKGSEYRNTPGLKVYGHGGEPCPRCGTALQRIAVSGRSSVFCPACQPESERGSSSGAGTSGTGKAHENRPPKGYA